MKDEMSPFGNRSLVYSGCASICVCGVFLLTSPLCLRIKCAFKSLRFKRSPSGELYFTCWTFLEETCRCPGCSSALASPGPGAGEWVRLAQQTLSLRGKWSVHNPGQWYLLVPHRLPLVSSTSAASLALITPRQPLPTVHLEVTVHLLRFLTCEGRKKTKLIQISQAEKEKGIVEGRNWTYRFSAYDDFMSFC